jgi:hypothetical protein
LQATLVAQCLGWAEVLFGLAMLVMVRHRWPFLLTIFLMIAATISVATHSPQFLMAAFNPAKAGEIPADVKPRRVERRE